MRMTFRWYGEKDDKITLQEIRQIPGMDGIVGALFDVPRSGMAGGTAYGDSGAGRSTSVGL